MPIAIWLRTIPVNSGSNIANVIPIERKRETAERWFAVHDQVRRLSAERDEPSTWWRELFGHRRRVELERSQRLRELHNEACLVKLLLESWSIGASLDWGVLSGGRGMALENTLRNTEVPGDSGRDLVEQILFALPEVRASAELGKDQGGVAIVESDLLRLIGSLDANPRERRALIEHLPGPRRPLPDSLDGMERGLPPITMFVSQRGVYRGRIDSRYEPYIELHDIVVTDELQGKGLGTAAMIELCRYADHHGYPIVGELEPGPRYADDAVEPLARWYWRLGFRQSNRQPSAWVRGRRISREPITLL